MSAKELVIMAKQKYMELLKGQDNESDKVSSSTQTDSNFDENIPKGTDAEHTEHMFIRRTVKDGLPGFINEKRKKKRKTIKWLPY